jgi:hypothetical protein
MQSDEHIPDSDPETVIYNAIRQQSFKIYVVVTCCAMLVLGCYGRYRELDSAMHSREVLLVNITLVALLGAYTVLATKCLSLLLAREFTVALGKPMTYIAGLILCATAVLQVAYLNRALKHFASTAVVPVHFAFFSVSVIVASAIAFHDFDAFDKWHMLIFVIGCATIFTGVWFTSIKTDLSSYLYGTNVVADSASESSDDSEQRFASPSAPLLHTSRRRTAASDDLSDPSSPFAVSVPGLGFGTVWQSRQSLKPYKSADGAIYSASH